MNDFFTNSLTNFYLNVLKKEVIGFFFQPIINFVGIYIIVKKNGMK